MKTREIREICGDYALDLELNHGGMFTMYFNSRQNALNVKRIIDVDNSVPNAATVCEMEETRHEHWIVVRDNNNYPVGLKCSGCGRKVRKRGENYCPNCGAKMDGGDGDG